MIRRKFLVLATLFVLIFPATALSQRSVVFSATVVKIEPWFPVKINCGVVLVTRLAEYRVISEYRGHLHARKVVVSHLACNGNELDNLRPGDKVIVAAVPLRTPIRRPWRTFKVFRSSADKIHLQKEKEKELVIRFSATKIYKLIYPTTAEDKRKE